MRTITESTIATAKLAGQRFLRGTDRSRFGSQASKIRSRRRTLAEQARRISGSSFIYLTQEKESPVGLFIEPVASLRWLIALLLRFVELGSVAGFLDGGDELLRVNFALLNGHHGFVRMGNLSADHTRNFFECGPHSFGAVDGSGHARDLKVHSFLRLLILGCLRVG